MLLIESSMFIHLDREAGKEYLAINNLFVFGEVAHIEYCCVAGSRTYNLEIMSTIFLKKNVNRHFNYFNGVEFHELLFSEEDQKMSLSGHCAVKINSLFFSFGLTSDVDSRISLTNTHDRNNSLGKNMIVTAETAIN
ncbi:hypothetical protein PHYBLDRAFT_173564 [Phycomyces blakesleeanus NRRL 1555(-)]|uniref:Uncharacterized protein n=1 Tax=Phycomyces blakesleeanus (strain ATCC 8743b / DSM 1359 / FGSC 10004 / NBRC 33097 / NRRL 1555) TaxID=763407 RepID=A0A163D1Q5_PHYB8|nr:hypothetical protein PHYBLDRAFT_173564 [Phycomyces blakesleeanus NRRL 1555(-)]OAD68070.1 hypothetical protein PHYBLDRAFT_173564 [Phycomyces blakesleeanus NRRL 1555(-)]|eukprot:XP_018286110.1 hypothetical protein PHYBLDRAFT_173564 [Phycomyces blakesleeanus NRRL 1555(-)]